MRPLFLATSILLAACGASQPLPADCTRGALEADLAGSGWQGPGVQADGGLPPSDAVVSTTYLALENDEQTQALFRSLFSAVNTDLTTRDGLIGYQVYTSTRCVSARTISVWRDQASMFSFASGDAHSAAAAKIGALSRGGSAVTHWDSKASDVTLETALSRLGAASAPF